jgi:long-chain acyl-CoA synthetase
MSAPLFSDALSAFQAAAAAVPDQPAILYFDGGLTYREVDRDSDALASALRARGLGPGDRLGLYLQNVPAFVLGLLAAWKLGAVPVPINPMNRAREVTVLLKDCTPKAVICHDTLFRDVIGRLPGRPAVVMTTSPLDWQRRNDPRLFTGITKLSDPAVIDLQEAIAAAGCEPAPGAAAPPPRPSDLAFLVYTSGTTGVPKGAMNTHDGAMYSAQGLCRWLGLRRHEPILGLAPLFHITGLVCHVLTAFVTASPLVLSYRFEPAVMLDAIEEHRPTFSIGATTAYLAMMHNPAATSERFRSLRQVCSGGAPVPASVVESFRARFGASMRNGFGMTETNAPVIFTPADRDSRVDPASQALSIGVPMPGVTVWVAGDDGQRLDPGQIGELVVQSPSLTAGYWNKPEETSEALRPDGLRTGDVGFIDADGWVFLVDRKKDMINASGYKVWPRDVEDVLYTHPAVREAAVVGIPDAYRGETVKVVISLKPGQHVASEEIVAFCRERMAAYKVPRVVEIVADLPKTPTGKIMRRALRDTDQG